MDLSTTHLGLDLVHPFVPGVSPFERGNDIRTLSLLHGGMS